MAGDALHRPLFKRGPEGNMRPQMISGGIFKCLSMVKMFP